MAGADDDDDKVQEDRQKRMERLGRLIDVLEQKLADDTASDREQSLLDRYLLERQELRGQLGQGRCS
jgi:hypothetical protein